MTQDEVSNRRVKLNTSNEDNWWDNCSRPFIWNMAEIDKQFMQRIQAKHEWILNEMYGVEELRQKEANMVEAEGEYKPQCKTRYLVDIAFAEDGSPRAYLKDEKYPIRFYTPSEFVGVVLSYKRLFMLLARNFWGWMLLLFGRKTIERWLTRHLEIYPIRPKEIHYSEVVKELRRVLTINPIWKDAISLILQNDMAYCYRFQDIIGNLDKEAFEKNPVKEIKRLAKMLMEREIGSGGMAKFKKVLPLALFIFRFFPKKKIKRIVKDIDLSHIKMSKEDIYWTNIVDNYNYRGLDFETRWAEYIKEKNNII